MKTLVPVVLAVAACTALVTTIHSRSPAPEDTSMELGNFSVSLTVKDLETSRAFYEKLGFAMKGGEPDNNWIVLQNETATIGLFQGMFERNIMTFNPGWDREGDTLDTFQDVREIQAVLKDRGITFQIEADEGGTGPASFVIADPDGNPILVDQHVPKSGGEGAR